VWKKRNALLNLRIDQKTQRGPLVMDFLISDDVYEAHSTSVLFQKALSTNLIQKDVEQIVPIVLARAGFEKRLIESGTAGEDALNPLRYF
jgi:hypothetical protein